MNTNPMDMVFIVTLTSVFGLKWLVNAIYGIDNFLQPVDGKRRSVFLMAGVCATWGVMLVLYLVSGVSLTRMASAATEWWQWSDQSEARSIVTYYGYIIAAVWWCSVVTPLLALTLYATQHWRIAADSKG